MLISEPTGLYILPLAMNLGANAYNLINEINLYLVPFIILIIYQVFAARAQGQDEGSPAVLALKRIEAGGIAMLFVIITFSQPWGTNPTFKYNQYSCAVNPSILNSNVKASDITGSDRIGGGVNNTSLFVGIIHDFSTAMSGALTSKIPCDAGANVVEITDSLSDVIPETDALYESIHSFNEQCYLPALSNVKAEQQKGNSLIHEPELYGLKKEAAFAFHSVLMMDAYQGRIANLKGGGAISPNPSLTISTTDTWYNVDQKNSTLNCASTSNNLSKAMLNDIQKWGDYSKTKANMMKFVSLYQTVTPSDINEELVNVMYQNVTGEVSGSRQASFRASKKNLKSGDFGYSSPSLERSLSYIPKDVTNESAGNFFINGLVYFGAFFKGVEETAKAHAALLIMPSMVTVVQGIIIASLPILALLSGYSIQAMYQVSLLYFGVCMVPYWLNVGTLFQTILSGLISSENVTTETLSYTIVGHYMIYMTPLVWLFLFQVLGTMAGSLLVNALQESTGAGDQAYKQFQSLAEQVKKIGGSVTDLLMKDKNAKGKDSK